jgi:hypothetical protein
MHDFRHATAEAMPELLRQLKTAGYKVVHVVPKAPVTTLAKYDDMVRSQDSCRSPTPGLRPASFAPSANSGVRKIRKCS